MKKEVFISVNAMRFGGIEKSLLAFIDEIKNMANIDLLIWDDRIQLPIPDYVHILRIPKVRSSLSISIKDNGFRLGDVICTLKARKMSKPWLAMPRLSKHYDIAIDYSHVGYVKYFTIDNVKADKKYAFYHHGAYNIAGKEKELDKEYYSLYTCVFAVASNIMQILRAELGYDFHCEVFPNFIPYKSIENQAAEKCPEMDNFSGLKLLTVGRLSREKNPRIIVDISRELKDRGIEYRYYVVGDGKERIEIEKRIAELGIERNVVMCGNQLNPYKFMKRCDVYVQMSGTEADPITVREVMIFSKSMILSKIPAFERISLKYSGIRLISYDVSEVVDAILDVPQDIELENITTEINTDARNCLMKIMK